MTSSSERPHTALRLVAAVLLFAACSGGDGPTVTPVPREVACNGAVTTVRELTPMTSVVLTGTDAACFALAGNDRTYLVIPQLTGAALPYGGYGFRLGDPSPTAVAQTQQAMPPVAVSAEALFGAHGDTQALLDSRLRDRERALRVTSARPDVSLAVASAEVPDTLRRFSVLRTLDLTPSYANVTARLRHTGSRVLVYLDTLASSTLSDADIRALGTIADTYLIPTVTAAFGSGSDIDANGRVIFLLTPTVNALVSSDACQTSGYVRGFFYSQDLSSTAATSNRGEIFYGFVPDESGRWSCAHSRDDVLSNLPPTFIHELQHMVSYGEHAVLRSGEAEEPWLNEGLSHLAEELGSRVYEARFPAPTGRTNVAQLFPDSAAPYITPTVTYSYRYLFSSNVYSLTSCAPGTFCTLAERGGTWLFLRWMADHADSTFLRRLVATTSTGRVNVEAATRRDMPSLLGDFAMSVWADSLLGVERAATPPALRFSSRNLRRLYRGLFDAVGLLGGVSRPFPIEPLPLVAGASLTGTMRPGTFLTYRLTVPAGTPSVRLRLSALDGSAFPLTSGAQVAVLRLP